MKIISYILLNVLLIITISGCAMQRAEIATKAKSSMIGMSKQQILQCMGAATNIQNQGNVDVWEYASGGDYRGVVNVYANDQYATGVSTFNKRYCDINIVFTNNNVTNVLYSGRTGGLLSKGEQCAFAVSNCVKQ